MSENRPEPTKPTQEEREIAAVRNFPAEGISIPGGAARETREKYPKLFR